MGILEALSFFWLFVAVLSAPPQLHRTDVTPLKIPNVALGSRKDCGVEKFLERTVHDDCEDRLLPIGVKNFFELSSATLCFGVYDTLYELCQYQNLTSFDVPKYTVINICKKASKSLESYNFNRGGSPFREWTPRLRSALGSVTNCTDICVHAADVNPPCAIIVAALERLPAAMAAAASAAAPSVNTTKSYSGKFSSPSAFQQPSSSTKSDVVVPKKNLLNQAEPVPANGEPKTEEVAVKPKDDIPVPLPEAEKTEQIVTPEDKSPPEAKLENQDPEPGEFMGAEEDDPQGLDGRQLDTVADQQPDLNLPKDAPSETKALPKDEAEGKPPVDTFGEPYLTISKKEDPSDPEETNMVTYFVLMTGGALLFYVLFHNKNKLLALALEGRRSGRRGGRHSSAAYSKLHSNLEETIASGPTSPSATHVLY